MKKKTYILDTSVVVKWYAPEKETDLEKARQLFFDAEAGKILVKTSDLLVHELSNALLKGKRLKEKAIINSLELFFQTNIEVIHTDFSLSRQVASLAIKYNLTAYDAVYAALAKKHKCQLISANPKCHGKIKDGSVVSLKNYQLI